MASDKIDLSVDLAPGNPHHLKLANPVMIASGTFGYDGYGGDDGYGLGITPEMDLSRLGAVIPKTVTHYPREGNPEPRRYPPSYREAPDARKSILLNSIGLANPGIKRALHSLLPGWLTWNAPLVLSISGESADQFGEMAAMTQGADGIRAIELNLSCPNAEDRVIFAHSPKSTADAVAAARSNTDLPLLVKLAPNVPDITEIAVAAVGAGADALTICNTIPAMTIDIESQKPVLGAGTGGLSGHGLRPVSLALVYRAAQVVGVPIIGVGGIFSPEHAVEFLMAGATAVQIGSANLVDPWSPFRILEGLYAYLGERGIGSIQELIGSVKVEATV